MAASSSHRRHPLSPGPPAGRAAPLGVQAGARDDASPSRTCSIPVTVFGLASMRKMLSTL
eukprot:254316-Hanusia_phi.AAC.1